MAVDEGGINSEIILFHM